MNPKINFILALGVVALFIISGSFYIVNETQRGVKVQFGEVVDGDIKPGIHWKIPVIQEVKYFDGRLQVLDAQPGEFLTSEKKRLIVDSFIVWRIKDVERYYIRTQGEDAAARLLMAPRVNDGLKNKIAERTLHQVVAVERDQIMEDLRQELDAAVGDELGIEVVDIRIKRVEFSAEVSETVYQRMRSERNRDAADHRARGRERAEGIRADADKQERILLAEAYREAEKVRGAGDAKAANLYAKAYGKDPKFYEFYRSLIAYKATFTSKSDLMIIDPNSEFFKYMNKSR
jgi:membrane protease subunit HflC